MKRINFYAALTLPTLVLMGGLLSLTAFVPSHAAPYAPVSSYHLPDGFLDGTWIVWCPSCHQCDQVDDITRNHNCEKCRTKTVDGGSAYVVCPADHINRVGGITRSHTCNQSLPTGGICGLPSRR